MRARQAGMAAMLAAAICGALSAAADEYNPNTDWMAGKVGILQHYLFSEPADVALPKMRGFDAAAVAEQLSDIGADFFMPTLLQVRPSVAAPNDVLEDLAGRPRGSICSQFDIPAELIREFRPRGIRLVLYAPATPPRHDRELCRRLGFKLYADPGRDPIFTRTGAENWGRVLEFWSRRYGDGVAAWWIDGSFPSAGFNAPEVRANEIYAKALKSGNPRAVVAFNPGFVLGKFVEEDDFTAGEINDPLMTVCPARWVQGRQWQLLTYTYQPLMFPNTVRYTDTEWIDWLGPVLSHGGCVMLDALGAVPSGLIPADRAAQLKVVFRAARGEDMPPDVSARLALERRIRRRTDPIDANAREHTHPENPRAFVAVDHARMDCVPDETLVSTNASGEVVWSAAIRKTLSVRGAVYLPPRVEPYLLDSPVVLASGQSLAGGALRTPLRDGCAAKVAPASGYSGPLVVAEGCRDVHVRGPVFCKAKNPLRFSGVDGLSVREVAFRGCGGVAVALKGCMNFRVDAVRVESPAADATTAVVADAASTLGIVRNVSVVGTASVLPVVAAGSDLAVACNGNVPAPKKSNKRTMRAFDYAIAGAARCRIEPSGNSAVDAEIAFFTNAVCRCTGALLPVGPGDAAAAVQLPRITFDVLGSGDDVYSITYPEAGHMLVSGTVAGCRWALWRLLADDFCVEFGGDGNMVFPPARNVTAASEADHSAPFERSGRESPVPVVDGGWAARGFQTIKRGEQ